MNAVSFSSARTTKRFRGRGARQQSRLFAPGNRRLKIHLQLLSMIAPRSLAVSARRLFGEKLPDHALLVLVLDAREQPCSQLSDCFWFIERQLLIHLAALKVTGLAAGLASCSVLLKAIYPP
jgi:hypothetical protein